jgi:hypothetical protein
LVLTTKSGTLLFVLALCCFFGAVKFVAKEEVEISQPETPFSSEENVAIESLSRSRVRLKKSISQLML